MRALEAIRSTGAGVERGIGEEPGPGPVPVRPIVAQRRREHGGVEDDQRRPRSVRRSLAAVESGTRPPALPPALATTSWTVGRAASSSSVARRYSWSDIPAAAARCRSTAWT